MEGDGKNDYIFAPTGAGCIPAEDNMDFLKKFEEQYIESKEALQKLKNDKCLLFDQVPMVEIDGMKLVQTRAILNYIAGKYNLYGKDLKERALIDMYCEGTVDLNEGIMMLYFKPADTKEKELQTILEKASTRYFPVYEKVLKDHGQDFLVGKQLSRADVQLLESILMVEELKADILSTFPLLKVQLQVGKKTLEHEDCLERWFNDGRDQIAELNEPSKYSIQAFKGRISNIPTIKKFLQPGSARNPPMNEKMAAEIMKTFH